LHADAVGLPHANFVIHVALSGIRNHIGCAMLVWLRLKKVAEEIWQTIYQLKHGLLADHLREQLNLPLI